MNNNNLKILNVTVTGWDLALNAARTTVHKEWTNKEPSDKFKNEMLLAEHSPIRLVQYSMLIKNVPYYVMGHIVRHHEGIEKFVSTSRPDRTHAVKYRSELKQTDLVDMMLVMNAQALINISKVRLCTKASAETRKLWLEVIKAIEKVDPIVVKYCVPQCIYRNRCPEPTPCGFFKEYKYER